MSKVIRAMKKVYWKGRKKIKKLPPVKAAKKYMGRKRNDESRYHGVVGFLDGSYFDFISSPMNDYVLYYIINYIILIY